MNEQQPKQPFPTWKQALLIFFSGIVLGLSSCGAFLVTVLNSANGSESGVVPRVFEAGFVIGGLTTLVGLVLILVRLFVGSRPEIAVGKADQLRKPGESNE